MNLSKRLLVLGIDSFDHELMLKFQADLPNVRRLMTEGYDIKLRGVFPPDSPTSWASIYTGLNPAKHGVLLFVDPLEKAGRLVSEEIDNSIIRYRTFWDIAGNQGRIVRVFYPLLGYPVWEVNGTMVGRATSSPDVQIYPPTRRKKELMNVKGLWGLPGMNQRGFIDDGRRMLASEVAFSREFIGTEWDLFFFYSSILDPIQHGFWNCFDPSDPTYKSGNQYEEVIKEFYVEYDKVLADFLRLVGNDTAVLLLSDHGHMRRPVNIVNVNRILSQSGYLSTTFAAKRSLAKSVKMKVYERKALVFGLLEKYRMDNVALAILRFMPTVKNVFTSPEVINWDETVAHVSDLSGVKAYTYGGIVIRREKLTDRSYEDVRTDIITQLRSLRDSTNNKILMKWIERREELYSGEFIAKYPDIVFEFEDDYGAGWSPSESLVARSDLHSVSPGSHRIDTPVMLLYDPTNQLQLERNQGDLVDVAPTILRILDVTSGSDNIDGRSLVK